MMQPGIDSAMRLTRSEAEAAQRLAVAMRAHGNRNAIAQPIDAGVIVSLGVERFVNRALFTASTIPPTSVSAVIEFFTSRGLPPSLQVPGWIDDATSGELSDRGFRPDWSRSLLAATTDNAVSATALDDRVGPDVVVSKVTDEVVETWLRILADGNETPPATRPISDEYGRAAHAISGSIDLLAQLGAEPVACGSLQIVDGVGWLGGAATLPSARGRGLQTRLLERRIAMAADRGAGFVAATALPDTASERNLVRAGLDIVDTQTVWTLET